MKKVLITGKNGYIGKSLEQWLTKENTKQKKNKQPIKYEMDRIDLKNNSWKNKDMSFSSYDVVVHTAGIAHIKETKKNKSLYYKVNRDLAYAVAKKAKVDGVKQFIFLSSMSVYGVGKGIIDMHTPIEPKNAYGKSKLEAEHLITNLQDNSFKVSILRPPMVYGKGCKGNYKKLSVLALKTPIFPKADNKRSMIYIDNLSEFVKNIIDDQRDGLFFPQNAYYVSTSNMVDLIAKSHNKKLIMIELFKPILNIFLNKLNIGVLNKVFGDLVYDMSMSKYEKNYIVCDFEESIFKTESRVRSNDKGMGVVSK